MKTEIALILNLLIIIIPLAFIVLYNHKTANGKNKVKNLYPVLFIIIMVQIIFLYLTKEILFFPFAGLTSLAMVFTTIINTGKLVNKANCLGEILASMTACVIAMIIPVAILLIGFVRVNSLWI